MNANEDFCVCSFVVYYVQRNLVNASSRTGLLIMAQAFRTLTSASLWCILEGIDKCAHLNKRKDGCR